MDKLRDRSHNVQLNGWECYIVNVIRARDQLLELQQLSGRHEVKISTAGFPECTAFIQEIEGADENPQRWKIQVLVSYPTLDLYTAGAKDLDEAKRVLRQLAESAILAAIENNYTDSTTV